MLKPSVADSFETQPLNDIYQTSLIGFADQLKTFFPNRETPVVMTFAPTALRELHKKKQFNPRTFPAFAFSVTQVSDNPNSYNAFALTHRGVFGRSASVTGRDDQVVTNRYHMTPALATINVLFIHQDTKDQIEFTQRWLRAARMRWLSFRLYGHDGNNEDDTRIDIRVEMDTNISIPDFELEDNGPLNMLQVTATMHTYHGTTNKRLSARAINMGVALSKAESSASQNASSDGKVDVTLTNLSNLE